MRRDYGLDYILPIIIREDGAVKRNGVNLAVIPVTTGRKRNNRLILILIC